MAALLKLRTVSAPEGNRLVVSYDGGKTFQSQEFCGDSWCHGQCGLPALVLRLEGEVAKSYGREEMKVYSSMTACGPVFQPFRVQWTGEKVFLPSDVGEPEKLMEMMWW